MTKLPMDKKPVLTLDKCGYCEVMETWDGYNHTIRTEAIAWATLNIPKGTNNGKETNDSQRNC